MAPPNDINSIKISSCCPGDSGGPAYKKSNEGLKIIGVNSFARGSIALNADGSVSYQSEDAALGLARLDSDQVQKWLRSFLLKKQLESAGE